MLSFQIIINFIFKAPGHGQKIVWSLNRQTLVVFTEFRSETVESFLQPSISQMASVYLEWGSEF